MLNKISEIFQTILSKLNGFDDVQKVQQGEVTLEYGIIAGNNTIVFLKSGLQDTCYGYENKYLKIANRLNKMHGCTVISASNPNGRKDDFGSEMEFLKEYASNQGWEEYQVYYMGHSNGANLGMIHAYKFPEIKKLVCINGPLVGYNKKISNGIKSFNGEKMNLIYGNKDVSFGIVEQLAKYKSDKVAITKFADVDHEFKGCLDLFIEIPGHFFFDDEIESENAEILP